MKHKQSKSTLSIIAQGVNGIAEMYAELGAKCTRLEGQVAHYITTCSVLEKKIAQLEKAVQHLQQDNQAALSAELMDAYCYGMEEGGNG